MPPPWAWPKAYPAFGGRFITRVHWDHSRDGKRFDQRGVEMYRMNADALPTPSSAVMNDTLGGADASVVG
jgi:hypothetical protein